MKRKLELEEAEEVVATVEKLQKAELTVENGNEEEKEPEEELDNFNTELAQRLEELSGLKFAAAVVQNTKDICKLLSSINKRGPLYCQNLQQKFVRVCEKYGTEEKRGKFLRKVQAKFGCEDELFKTLLKHGMRSSENNNLGAGLISMLNSLFSLNAESGQIMSPVLGIQMIVSHSKAADIFLESHSLSKIKTLKGELPPEPKFSMIKTELLKLWLTLVISFSKISKLSGTESDKKILENSVPYLMQMYDATLSTADKTVFQILKVYTSKKLGIVMESMPLFGPKCFDTPPPGAANPLYAHSTRANSILDLIEDTKAFQTAVQYNDTNAENCDSSEKYDMRFLLPLLCHVLDQKNICDSVKVVSNGWIYFVVRGMSLGDKALRSSAFLAYQRLILNYQQARGWRLQDVKIWLHFLLSVKRGFSQLGECKLSNLLSLWLVAAWEVVRQPSHLMYQRITHFLLAKPIIELTILPDFVPFYNAADGNKESREWILNVLAHGLKTKEDWKIAQKLPTVKFLCSSFLLEKVVTQKAIVKILSHGASIPEMALDMVDKHSLPLWLSNISATDRNLRMELELFFKNLTNFCPPNVSRECLFNFVAKKQDWGYEKIIDDAGSIS